MGDEYHGPDIYSRASGDLRLLPASGLLGGSSLLGSGGRPSGSAFVWSSGGEALSSAFMERAKRPVLGPPGPEQR
jgi:hypothetical protein